MICDVCELEQETVKKYAVAIHDDMGSETIVRMCQHHYIVIKAFIEKTNGLISIYKKDEEWEVEVCSHFGGCGCVIE